MGVVTRPESTAVRVIRNQPSTLGAYLMTPEATAMLAPLLAKGDKLERIAQVAVLEARRNPALLECDPMSVLESVSHIMAWGLEVGETAYLVPFGNKCQPVKGYKGLIQLMMDSGHVRSVDAHEVYATDVFEYEYGLHPVLKHIPGNQKSRGPVTHAYCVVRLPFGHHVFKVMTADEIDAIRQQHSKQWKKGALPVWYCLKTAIIHTSKLLPKDSKFAAIHEAARVAEVEEAEIVLPEVTDTPADIDPATGEDLSYEPTNDGTVRKADTDTAWAFNYALPGSAKAWGGNGGKRLGELESKSGNRSLLRQIIDYAAQRPDDEQLQALGSAAQIVLDVRLREAAEAQGSLGLAEPEPKGRNAVAEGR